MSYRWIAALQQIPLPPGEVAKIQIPDGRRIARFIECSVRPEQPYSFQVERGNELSFKNIDKEPWTPELALIIEEGTGTTFDWPVVLQIAPGDRGYTEWHYPSEPFKLERINVHIPYRLPQDTLRLSSVQLDQVDQLLQEVPTALFQDRRDLPSLDFEGGHKLRLDFHNVGDVPLEALVWLQGRMPLKREDPP